MLKIASRPLRKLCRAQPSGKRTALNFLRSKSPYRIRHGPGVISPIREVPDHIPKPEYTKDGWVSSAPKTFETALMAPIVILSPEEINLMRDSCKLAREILDYAGSLVRPGITTEEIDRLVHEAIIKQNAYPSPLQYPSEHGARYPKSVCTSVNNVVCHGIPDDIPLQEGDTLNIDVTVFRNGFHGDCSATYAVGEVSPKAHRLMKAAKEGLEAGIGACAPGQLLSNIGRAIQNVATKYGYGIPEALTGHGVGREFHTVPFVFHVDNQLPWIMEPGMVFTIEPIFLESTEGLKMWDDHWTLATQDNTRAAQFENTVLITDNGVEILTKK